MRYPLWLFLGTRAFRGGDGARLPVFALALGVALLLASLSVMNGFEQALRERVLGLIPQLILYPNAPRSDWQALAERALQYPEVEAAAPIVSLSGMLWAGGRSKPALVQGVVPSAEASVSSLPDYLPPGALAGLGMGEVILGRGLAAELDVGPGDFLRLLVPGRGSPRVSRLRVRALFHSGTKLDEGLALLSLAEASALAGHPGAARALRLRLAEPFAAPALAPRLQRDMQMAARDWTLDYGVLFAAVRISRRLVVLLLFSVLAIASFSVVSGLLVTVGRRRGELALLRTIGAPPGLLFGSILVRGAWIGLAGSALGVAGGAVISLCVPKVAVLLERMLGLRLLAAEIYPLDYLPAALSWQDMLLASLLAMLVCLPAALYPAWRAFRLPPAEVLRE